MPGCDDVGEIVGDRQMGTGRVNHKIPTRIGRKSVVEVRESAAVELVNLS
jgi:hypothetical protein